MSKMEKNDKNQAVLTFTIDGGEFDAATDKVYKKTAARYNIPGFRKGKAPRKLIEKYYGAGVFFEDAFNEIFPKYYQDAVKEHELFTVERPEIDVQDIADDGSVTVVATVTLKPEVTLGEYKGIKIEKEEYTVSDSDMEAELKKAQDNASRFIDIEDRPVQDGDTVTLNYAGSVDGVAFAGGTAENQTLVIGSGSFIPGFEEQMVGMKLGEEKDLQVKFPEDYHAEDLKGKEAIFHVAVLGIKEKQVPALDDEFAKDVSEFDTLEEYKESIRKNLDEANKKKADSEFENKLIDAVAANAQAEIPDVMVESQLDYQMRDMEMRMSYQGLRMQDYLQYTGTTVEQLRDMYREEAKNTVKTRLTLEAIIKAESITADDEAVEKEIARYAEMMRKPLEEYKATLKDEELEYIKDGVVMAKAVDFLKENNEAIAPKPAKKAAKKTTKKAETEAEAAPADEEASAEKPAPKKRAPKKTAEKTEE